MIESAELGKRGRGAGTGPQTLGRHSLPLAGKSAEWCDRTRSAPAQPRPAGPLHRLQSPLALPRTARRLPCRPAPTSFSASSLDTRGAIITSSPAGNRGRGEGWDGVGWSLWEAVPRNLVTSHPCPASQLAPLSAVFAVQADGSLQGIALTGPTAVGKCTCWETRLFHVQAFQTIRLPSFANLMPPPSSSCSEARVKRQHLQRASNRYHPTAPKPVEPEPAATPTLVPVGGGGHRQLGSQLEGVDHAQQLQGTGITNVRQGNWHA